MAQIKQELGFRNIDFQEILGHIRNFATSETSKALILELAPLASPQKAQSHMQEIASASKILQLGIRPHLKSADLYPLWHDRLSKGAVLKAIEFRDVRLFCIEVIAVEEALASGGSEWAKNTKAQLMEARRPLSAIEQILSPDGEIRTDASEKLHSLYKEKLEKEREIRNTLDRLVKAHEMETLLQDKYVTNREGRWVLPIRSGMRHNLDGIIHDFSQTKQTVFMEPQAVVMVNNQLRQIEVAINEEIERLLKELSQFLATLLAEFAQSRKILVEVDLLLAEAQFAVHVHAEAPDFSEGRLHLKDLRHPLLTYQLGPEQVIPNTVTLDQEHSVLILSGPNAGGKTVLLKSIGLAAHMARCGLPICAGSGSQIPFFTKILSAVGDSQSVDQHLSTFAAHLKMLSEALGQAGQDKLVLIDEICGSTDPEEGAALARSFIESYARQNVFAVITSHLGPLKSGWENTKILTGSMDFNDQRGLATYQFLPGTSGRSLAIKTAKKVGVPDEIVNRALELISPEARERENQLSALEEVRTELNQTRDQYQKLVNETRALKLRYSEMIEKFRAQRDEWMKRAVEMAEKKINAIYEELRQDQLKNKSLGDFKAMLPQIVKGPQRQSLETAEDFAKYYPPGSTVYVKNLNQDAIVQGSPNNKGEVPILSNSMRLFVHWTNLTTPKSAPSSTATLARRGGVMSVSLPDREREIDLRGQRVEEALELLETELDSAVRNHEDRIKIIHGHGTDALKKAVRAYFSRSTYVKQWKAGDAMSGGDGVTWVEIEG